MTIRVAAVATVDYVVDMPPKHSPEVVAMAMADKMSRELGLLLNRWLLEHPPGAIASTFMGGAAIIATRCKVSEDEFLQLARDAWRKIGLDWNSGGG